MPFYKLLKKCVVHCNSLQFDSDSQQALGIASTVQYLIQVVWYQSGCLQTDVNQLFKAVSVWALGSGHWNSKVQASFASTQRLVPSTTRLELLKNNFGAC